jgi:hypothetical protein
VAHLSLEDVTHLLDVQSLAGTVTSPTRAVKSFYEGDFYRFHTFNYFPIFDISHLTGISIDAFF